MNEPSTTAEIARIARWASEISSRRLAGETVTQEELVEYQRAKVAVLGMIAERDPSPEAAEVLADAQTRLAELEAGR